MTLQSLSIAGLGMQLLGQNLVFANPVSRHINESTHSLPEFPSYDDGLEDTAFTKNTSPEKFVTCYPKDDQDFTPVVPGFESAKCDKKWHDFFEHKGSDTLLHWWSDDGTGRRPAEAVEPALQAAAINMNAEGCAFLVVSSFILDRLVAESEKTHSGRHPDLLKWRSEWGLRDAPYLTKMVDISYWSDVINGFGEILDCIDDRRSGHKRIGELCTSISYSISS